MPEAAPGSRARDRTLVAFPLGPVSALAPALRSEWIKATAVRSTRTVLGRTADGGLLVSWAVGVLVTDQVQYVAEVGFSWTTGAAASRLPSWTAPERMEALVSRLTRASTAWGE